MIAAAYVQNGAKGYIASRKEKQLKEVCPRRGVDPYHALTTVCVS